MEKQKINGIKTRRKGENIEIETNKGWKITTDPIVLDQVKNIELIECMNKNPMVYK